MGRTDTFREAMTAARSLHNRIRNHAIVSTFLLTVLVGVLRLHAITRHSRDARLREFFFERCSSPAPFHPPVERARESRCIGSLGIVPIQLFKVENNFYSMRFYSMRLNVAERSNVLSRSTQQSA